MGWGTGPAAAWAIRHRALCRSLEPPRALAPCVRSLVRNMGSPRNNFYSDVPRGSAAMRRAKSFAQKPSRPPQARATTQTLPCSAGRRGNKSSHPSPFGTATINQAGGPGAALTVTQSSKEVKTICRAGPVPQSLSGVRRGAGEPRFAQDLLTLEPGLTPAVSITRPTSSTSLVTMTALPSTGSN